MAIVRVTAQTALPTGQRLAADLARCVEEAGRLPSTRRLAEDLVSLSTYGADGLLEVDVAVAGALNEMRAAAVANWICSDLSPTIVSGTGDHHAVIAAGPIRLSLHVFPAGVPPVRKAATSRAPVLVCVLASADVLDVGSAGALEALFEDRPHVSLLLPRSFGQSSDLRAMAQERAWHVQLEDLDALTRPTLVDRFAALPSSSATDLLRAHAVMIGLDSASQVLASVIDQEVRGIRVKRSMTQQKASRLQPTSAVGTSELLTDIRNRITRQFTDFERGAAERLASLFTPQIGTLWRETESRLENINGFDEEKKAKSTVMRIPQRKEAELLETVRHTIRAHATADLVAMRDLFQVTSGDIEQLVGDDVPLMLHFQYLGTDRLQRLVDVSLRMDKSYKGELPRKGPMEYFMGARRYQMLVYMLMSTFGLTALRRHGTGMIVVSLVLLGFGGFMVSRSVKEEREEGMAKELERARDTVRMEMRRVFAELERGWLSLLTDHLKGQLTSVLAQVDGAVREAQAKKSTEAADEKRRVQRQIQSLEALERQLIAADKARDGVASSVAQLRGELRQLFFTTIEASAKAAAKPAMAPTGSGAVPRPA